MTVSRSMRATPPVLPNPSPARAQDPIGRHREIDLLSRLLESATAGLTHVAVVAGEPGIGKTRLIDAIARRAAQGGMVVLHAGAWEAQGMPPYLLFLEALGPYLRDQDDATVQRLFGSDPEPLVSLLPEFAARVALPPAVLKNQPAEYARRRLLSGVADMVAAIAKERGLLLALDDLHWADAASLDMLCYLIRAQGQARLLVVGAFRAGEAATNPALERTLVELNHLRVLTNLPLGPLDLEAIGTLAGAQLQGSIEPALKVALHQQSEGNPFFAEEILRDWSETGHLQRVDSSSDMWRRVVPSSPSIPATISAAVRQRLARLAPETVDLLRLASVVGRAFDSDVLSSLASADPEHVERHMTDAVRARILHDAGDSVFHFAHDTIRECLYTEVTAVRRRRLHAAIGEALERRGTTGSRHLADLAFHFTRAGDRARGATYALAAADRALASSAGAEAQALYTDALALTDAGKHSVRGSVAVRLGNAALLAGDIKTAAVAFEQAGTEMVAAGDDRAAADAAHRLGQAWARVEEHARAERAYRQALRLLESSDADPPLEVRVLVDLAALLGMSLGRNDESLAVARRALRDAGALAEPTLLVGARRTLGNLLVRANQLPAGIKLLEQALADADALDDPVEGTECCAGLNMAYGWYGDLHRAEVVSRRREVLARRTRDPFQLRHVHAVRAMAAFDQGDLDTAEQLLAEARSQVEGVDSPEPLAFLQLSEALACRARGTHAQALGLMLEAMQRFRAMGPGITAWYIGDLAMVQAAAGDLNGARATIAEAEDLLSGYSSDSMVVGETLTYACEAAARIGDTQTLIRLEPRLRPFGGQNHDFLVDRLLGHIALVRGDTASAERLLAMAEDLARAAPFPPELARVQEAQADLALVRPGGASGRAAAHTLLSAALTGLETVGFLDDAGRVREKLDAIKPAPTVSVVAGLSPRELDVVRLVAAGYSNRQIAAELVVSEKTVINHLTSIFNKLGVENRAGAAAFAIRHSLA
jgi:ATP/maltotriose-dependent transcriptional regulator MalT